MNKTMLIPAFILMVLLQLYIPGRMISRKESILSGGKDFRFKTAPIDPTDPFRGKYITLSFNANSTQVANAEEWNQGDPIFVMLGEDEKGFVKINSIITERPADTEDYVKASIRYIIADTISYVTVEYPFSRFYMDEFKAEDAQNVYGEAAMDTNQVAYAIVSIKNGDAVIKDVMIDNVPIKDVVKARLEKKPE
ncbi:MAG: GDYXXLXY domain-containing protein [Saprospiraceae bacterium]